MLKEVEMYIKEENGCVWKKYDIKFNDYVYKTTIEINIKEDILYIDDKPLIKILKKVDNSN